MCLAPLVVVEGSSPECRLHVGSLTTCWCLCACVCTRVCAPVCQFLQLVTFLLEDKLKELGGQFSRQADWAEHVVTDGNLITGQNPGSARKLGEVLVQQLNEKRAALGGSVSGGVTFSAGEAGLVGGK